MPFRKAPGRCGGRLRRAAAGRPSAVTGSRASAPDCLAASSRRKSNSAPICGISHATIRFHSADEWRRAVRIPAERPFAGEEIGNRRESQTGVAFRSAHQGCGSRALRDGVADPLRQWTTVPGQQRLIAAHARAAAPYQHVSRALHRKMITSRFPRPCPRGSLSIRPGAKPD